MSWIDDNNDHELFIAPITRDGASDERDPADIVGWEVRCICYLDEAHRRYATTTLARWERVSSPEDQDRAAGRFYADDEDASYMADREDVERLAKSLWDVHRKPLDALRLIETAAEANAAARAQLDAAVTAGRAVGLSWADVGRAVGITRQSARERWGAREETAPA